MLLRFQKHITKEFPQLEKSKLGIAISGGVDSVVLAHLCYRLGIQISLLHCNFQLRGEASNGDQAFVKRLAEKWDAPLITTEFNTRAYIEIHKVSTQVGARELRYRWFNKMLKLYHLDSIATAHHLDDNVETFLINLSRGTGLEGLTGIPEVNPPFLRPLLPFSRKEILEYARHEKLEWREDASNSETKYLRNHIRHKVIPKLKTTNPQFLENFQSTVSYLKKSQKVVNSYVQNFKKQYVHSNRDIRGFEIDLLGLKQEHNIEIVLFEVLKDFGFKAWSDIQDLIFAQTGKKIFSATHTLLKNRTQLLLYPTIDKEKVALIELLENSKELVLSENEKLLFDTKELSSKKIIRIDKNRVKFPLTVRKWREGDYFYPEGMEGKKKIGKYFKDEKFSIPQKENTWLLCNDDEIIWLIGHRKDRRYLADNNSEEILSIQYKTTD